ncbi:hypothetical protein FRC11_002363, partial [Ceratobasidium sp. 423]
MDAAEAFNHDLEVPLDELERALFGLQTEVPMEVDRPKLPTDVFGNPTAVKDWCYVQRSQARSRELLSNSEVLVLNLLKNAVTPGRDMVLWLYNQRKKKFELVGQNPLRGSLGRFRRSTAVLEVELIGRRSDKYIRIRLLFYYKDKWETFPNYNMTQALHEAAVNIGARRTEMRVRPCHNGNERIAGPAHFWFTSGITAATTSERLMEMPHLYELDCFRFYEQICLFVNIESECIGYDIVQGGFIRRLEVAIGGKVGVITHGGRGSTELLATCSLIASNYNVPVFTLTDADGPGASIAAAIRHGTHVGQYQRSVVTIPRAQYVCDSIHDLMQSDLRNRLAKLSDNDFKTIDNLLSELSELGDQADPVLTRHLKSMKETGKGFSLSIYFGHVFHTQRLINLIRDAYLDLQSHPVPAPAPALDVPYPPTATLVRKQRLPRLKAEPIEGGTRIMTEYEGRPVHVSLLPLQSCVSVICFGWLQSVEVGYAKIHKMIDKRTGSNDIDHLEGILGSTIAATQYSTNKEIQQGQAEVVQYIALLAEILAPIRRGKPEHTRSETVAIWRFIMEETNVPWGVEGNMSPPPAGERPNASGPAPPLGKIQEKECGYAEDKAQPSQPSPPVRRLAAKPTESRGYTTFNVGRTPIDSVLSGAAGLVTPVKSDSSSNGSSTASNVGKVPIDSVLLSGWGSTTPVSLPHSLVPKPTFGGVLTGSSSSSSGDCLVPHPHPPSPEPVVVESLVGANSSNGVIPNTSADPSDGSASASSNLNGDSTISNLGEISLDSSVDSLVDSLFDFSCAGGAVLDANSSNGASPSTPSSSSSGRAFTPSNLNGASTISNLGETSIDFAWLNSMSPDSWSLNCPQSDPLWVGGAVSDPSLSNGGNPGISFDWNSGNASTLLDLGSNGDSTIPSAPSSSSGGRAFTPSNLNGASTISNLGETSTDFAWLNSWSPDFWSWLNSMSPDSWSLNCPQSDPL